jgi:hypothetical protein
MACVDACELKCVKVEENQHRIVFQYETDGSLTAKALLLFTLKMLEEKYTGFIEMISNLQD